MKPFLILSALLQLFCVHLYSQSRVSYDTITFKLKEENEIVRMTECRENNAASAASNRQEGKIITNQALNIFFANKIASFLSDGGDLSLFGSYATLGTDDGRLSINHNIWVKKSEQGRIRRMTTIGVRADISDGFASIFSNKSFNNDIGLSIKQTWLHRGVVTFDECSQRQARSRAAASKSASSHKEIMNIKRAMIIAELEGSIERKSNEFETQLAAANITEELKKSFREEFYSSLNDEAFDQFATKQYEALEATEAYHQIRTSWTSIWGYIPATSKKFTIAPSYPADFAEQQLYPWEINLSHSRIWESPTFGRSFFTISAGAFGNNNINTEVLEKISSDKYIVGVPSGTDTLNLAKIGADEVYIGSYEKFATSVVKAQYVWFPPKFFAGISLSLEQNFGKYNPLNLKFGFPMRFKDSDGKPSINLELQLRTSDATGNIFKDKSFQEKSTIGISIGVPFSGFLY